MTRRKVTVVISYSTYTIFDKRNGKRFIYIDYGCWLNGVYGNYGGSREWVTKEELKKTIEEIKETIIKEGDVPIVIDKRKKQEQLSLF